MELQIRKACVDDLATMSAVALAAKGYWGYPQNMLDSFREELTYHSADIQTGEYYVAEVSDAFIGFCALVASPPRLVELVAMFVEPSFIGKGYGRALMKFALQRARAMGAQKMHIQSDPNALAFYEAAGGVITGESESDSIPGRFLPTLSIDL